MLVCLLLHLMTGNYLSDPFIECDSHVENNAYYSCNYIDG